MWAIIKIASERLQRRHQRKYTDAAEIIKLPHSPNCFSTGINLLVLGGGFCDLFFDTNHKTITNTTKRDTMTAKRHHREEYNDCIKHQYTTERINNPTRQNVIETIDIHQIQIMLSLDHLRSNYIYCEVSSNMRTKITQTLSRYNFQTDWPIEFCSIWCTQLSHNASWVVWYNMY